MTSTQHPIGSGFTAASTAEEVVKGIDLTDPHAAAEKLKIGTRVITTFVPERKGEMLDFWFELAA